MAKLIEKPRVSFTHVSENQVNFGSFKEIVNFSSSRRLQILNLIFRLFQVVDSGAQAARRATKQSPITTTTEPHACIKIGNHATLLSWSTWLAAQIAGACA